MVRILASALGLALGLLWLVVWWSGALNGAAGSRFLVLLDFNGSGEAVFEGVLLHLVIVFLVIGFLRNARGA